MTHRYTIRYAPRARRDLRKLPEKIATACVEFVSTALADNPHRVGKTPYVILAGYYSARRADSRIIYRIDDDKMLIEVVAIARRADSYRPL